MSSETTDSIGWRYLAQSGLMPQFFVLCFAVWLHAANSMLAATTLPSAVDELGGAHLIAWAFTLYQLGSILAGAAAGLLAGKVVLRHGLAGAALVYAVGSVVCASAPVMQMVLAGRLLQGAGGGMLLALSYVALNRNFPHDLLPRLIAAISAVWSTSAFCGPLIGGTFSTYGLWRFGFWAFAVQAVVFVVFAMRTLSENSDLEERPASRFPVVRLAILTAAILAVGFASTWVNLITSPILCVAALVLVWVFLKVDASKSASRMFPSGTLKISEVSGAGLAFVAIAAFSTMSFLVYGPILLEVLYDVSPLVAGYIIALESIAWGAAAIIFSRYDGPDDTWLIQAGTAIVSLGVLGFAITMPSGQLWLVIACAIATGAGFGMMWGFVIRHIVSAAPDAQADVTATSIPTTQQIAFAMGAAAAGIVANTAGFSDGVSVQSAEAVAFWAFAAFVPFALFANVAAWKLISLNSSS